MPAHSVEMKQSDQRTIVTILKYFSNNDPPTENSFMRTTSELDNTVYPNPSRNSRATIQYVPWPSIKLALWSISATTNFINSTGKADISEDTTMSPEPENKPIKQTSTPLVNYKTNSRSKNDTVSFKIKPISPSSTIDNVHNIQSQLKLIRLFGDTSFVKFFDIARKKKRKKDIEVDINLIIKQNY